jgi:hypothetical protein
VQRDLLRELARVGRAHRRRRRRHVAAPSRSRVRRKRNGDSRIAHEQKSKIPKKHRNKSSGDVL